ncbi:MAG TPA: hypothetical protein VM935_17650 [Chitinophagaceae bacterium]|jgi:hypothetical protein|nr:hypothetical protein [Chitinophagaceae bacterium]
MERQTTHAGDGAVIGGVRQISWPAIFAGALIAIGIQLLLALLGIGIGAGSVDPQEEQNPMAGIGTGALIWWIISFLLSLFSGGWVAGRLTGTRNKFNDSVHGVLTWVVFVLLNLWLLTSAAGSLIRSASGVLGSTVSMLGQGAAMNAPELGNKIGAEADKRGIDQGDVQNTVDSLQSKIPEIKAKAREVGDDVAKGVSKGGIYGFIGLLIGAIVASLGAVIGRRSYEGDIAVMPTRKRTS